METGQEIEILVGGQVQNPPPSTNDRFYKIYSPEKIELGPFESKVLDVQLKIKLPYGVQDIISLLPIFEQSLTLENRKRITSQTWNGPIKLELVNKNFDCKATIEKNEEIGKLILLPGRDFVSRYKYLQQCMIIKLK